MATEHCYRCGKPLGIYFGILCDSCRRKCEAEEAASEAPKPATAKDTEDADGN